MTDEERTGNVYQRDGVWVYRMSGLGKCLKGLVAARAGLEPLDPPEWMEERMREGTKFEQTIIDMSARKVERQQEEVVLEIDEGVQLVGHIDGVTDAEGISEEWGDGLAEVKKFRGSLWDGWRTTRWMESGAERLMEMFPAYATQMSGYMYGLGVDWGLFIVGHAEENDDGEVEITEVDITVIEKPPVPLRAIKGRVLKVERLAEKFAERGELPGCDRKDFPCPFFYLEEDDTEEGPEELDMLATLYKQGVEFEKRGKELKKESAPEIAKIFDAMDKKDGRLETKNWKVKDTLREGKKYFDKEAAKEDGVEVEKYMKKGKGSRHPTITGKKKAEKTDGEEG